jgi:hypothetical protein
MALGGTGLSDQDPLDLTNLASRSDLPPRARQVLEGVLGLFSRNLERSLVPVLDEFEISLVRQASKSNAGESGQRSLESIRKLKSTRNQLLPRLVLALEHGVARLDQRAASAPKKTTPLALALEDLELVGATDLDETLTLQDMAARLEARHSLALYELGHRFAVLVARPAFHIDAVPLGPAHVGEALRYAAAALDVPIDHRVLLYEAFDRLAMSGVGALYAAANLHFVEQGIFRHLQVQTSVRGRDAGARPGIDARPSASPAAASEPSAAPRPGPKKTSTMGEDTAAFGLAAFEVVSTQARVSRPSAPPPRDAPVLRSAAEMRDAEQFKPVSEWLAARRRVLCINNAMKDAAAYEPSAREVQTALGTLQIRSPPTIMLGGKVVHRTLAQLKQDLLNQLRHVTPPGQALQLGDEDTDTIEVLGLLFDELMHTLRSTGRTPSLLTRLQVPILRVALRDKGFFLRADHPARQLLNTVAETGVHWIDDVGGESDVALIERVQRAIERVNNEFDSDLKLLERINDDLLLHMQSLARRADVAERRLVDAARGREKLAMARETASRAISSRLAAAKPSRLLRTLLEQAWTDVLALTVLRQGEGSETYRRQLDVADQLIAASDAGPAAGGQPLTATSREEIETSLAQVGYHEDEVRAVVDRVFTSERPERDDTAISQTDLAMRLKSKMRLGETVATDAPMQSAQMRQASLQLNAEETQMLERLKSMPAGAWFELIGKTTNDRTRLKLSWLSPMSGRCLLVNQRGARVDECDLDHLARDIVAGRVRLSPPERESLVDRSWKGVATTLRQFVASAQNATVPQ